MAKWKQLIAARERKHLSQREAARRLNVGLVTYQRWELGKATPQPLHMRFLCEAFHTQLDHPDALYLHITPTPPIIVDTSPPPQISLDPVEDLSTVAVIDEPQVFIHTHMITHLWSVALMQYSSCNKCRDAIRHAIKEYDTMNPTNQNYQMNRREALCGLATLPMMTLGLTRPGNTVLPAQYSSILVQCAASIEACWELYQSGDAHDTTLAFKTVSQYLSVLQEICQNASSYRKEALDLATHYALLKSLLGWVRVGPTETLLFAKNAVALSKETGDISLQLSAYCKLAWAYYYDKNYVFALTAAQKAEMLLQSYNQRPNAQPLHPCVLGGTYSTLALMQAKNGVSPDVASGKAFEHDTAESYAFMTSKRRNLLVEAGWTYCYHGNQAKAMETLQQRIDPETLAPKLAQSVRGRIETINVMALSSLKTTNRDMEQTIHYWVAGMEGAKTLKDEQRFKDALATYEFMEVIWPNEKVITNLRERIVHW